MYRKPPLCILTTLFLSIFFFSTAYAATYSYCDVLHKSLLFYEAQRSGSLPSSNRVPWRGNSALQDCTSIACVLQAGQGNLAGGYYDAGDGVKFMFPAAFSTTTLAWGYIQFRDAVAACGETQYYLDAIKWSTDFIIKAHPSESVFWGQIGNGGIDHSWWGPPELMSMSRPTYQITPSNPGTELALEAASALAAASIAFKPTDPTYSALLLTHARQLYTLGYNYRGFYSSSIPDAANYYKSYGYNDELVWGSSWLYRATGESSFLNAAKSDYNTYNIKQMSPGQAFSWDQKSPGVLVNMWQATGDAQYLADAQNWQNSWYPGGGKTYTPGGLVWESDWGPLRYASGSAFLMLIISDSRANSWAKAQIDYMLGSNPSQRSFVCGYGNNPPINPHHRAAHGSTTNDINNPPNNLHILTGALVGGPDKYDTYADVRTDYVKNEVALDYNAAFTGALAGLAKLLGQSVVSTTTTPPLAPTSTTTPPKTTTTTTAPAPPISQATSRPNATITITTTTTPTPTTQTPTTTTTAPTTTTTTTTTAPAAAATTGKISIQMNSGTNVWWVGVAVINAAATTAKVEFTDGGAYPTWTAMITTTWGYWIFSPSSQLTTPISLRLTSTAGAVVILPSLFTSLTQFTAQLTTSQYGASSRSTRDPDHDARARAIANTPLDAGSLKLKVHKGSSKWWLAVAIYDAIDATVSVEAKDKQGNIFTLRDGKWGYWVLDTRGSALALPLTLTSTSASGSSVSFRIARFVKGGYMIDSKNQY